MFAAIYIYTPGLDPGRVVFSASIYTVGIDPRRWRRNEINIAGAKRGPKLEARRAEPGPPGGEGAYYHPSPPSRGFSVAL